MKRLLAIAVVMTVVGCGNSSGPAGSRWVGSWSVYPANLPGYWVYVNSATLTLRDSAGKTYGSVPSFGVVDSAGVGGLTWSSAAAVENSSANGDTLVLRVNGAVDLNYGYTWWLELKGVKIGNTLDGTVTIGCVQLAASGVIGTWTAIKQ